MIQDPEELASALHGAHVARVVHWIWVRGKLPAEVPVLARPESQAVFLRCCSLAGHTISKAPSKQAEPARALLHLL